MRRIGHNLVLPASLQTLPLEAQDAQSDVLGLVAGVGPNKQQLDDQRDGH